MTANDDTIIEGAIRAGQLAKEAIAMSTRLPEGATYPGNTKHDAYSEALDDLKRIEEAAMAAAIGGYVGTHLAPVSTIVAGGKVKIDGTVRVEGRVVADNMR